MERRQKILLAALAVMAVLYLGDWLMQSVIQGPLQARRDRITQLQERVARDEEQLASARRALQQLPVWEAKSLPADPEVARSVYQAWLVEVISKTGFQNPHVDSGEAVNQDGFFHVLSFSLRGQATLDQFTSFLYQFYHPGYLHRIRSINITPRPGDSTLDLSIAIEALALPTAASNEALPPQQSNQLAFSDLQDYRPLIQRDLFGVGRRAGAVELTYLTAVILVDGQPQAWFTLRQSGEVLKLSEGDPLHVGAFQGTVDEIAGSDVVLASEQGRWLVTVGENLAEAFALPPEF